MASAVTVELSLFWKSGLWMSSAEIIRSISLALDVPTEFFLLFSFFLCFILITPEMLPMSFLKCYSFNFEGSSLKNAFFFDNDMDTD